MVTAETTLVHLILVRVLHHLNINLTTLLVVRVRTAIQSFRRYVHGSLVYVLTAIHI